MADVYSNAKYRQLVYKRILFIEKYNSSTNKWMRIYYNLRIEYVVNRLKKIDRSIGVNTSGGGNYNINERIGV